MSLVTSDRISVGQAHAALSKAFHCQKATLHWALARWPLGGRRASGSLRTTARDRTASPRTSRACAGPSAPHSLQTVEGNCMPELGCGSVQLLNVDPELARELDPRRAREAAQRLYARAIDIPRGRWTPGAGLLEGSRPIGLLVIEGMLMREATVGDHPSAELLGPGDLLRAWEDVDSEE